MVGRKDRLLVDAFGMPDGNAVCYLTADTIGREGSTIMTALGKLIDALLSSGPNWHSCRYL